MPQFIGTGEGLVNEILHILYPKSVIKTQVKLSSLVHVEPSWRQSKETLDIVFWKNGPPIGGPRPDFVVRIQNKKGGIRMNHEDRQRRELEEIGIKVVDITHWEHPDIFKEVYNYRSFLEVCSALQGENVVP